jgi:hypothetical protein
MAVIPTLTFSCRLARGEVVCTIAPTGAKSRAKVTARLLGTRSRAVREGRGKLRLRLKARGGARRVELRYVSKQFRGRAVVRVGTPVKLKVKRR